LLDTFPSSFAFLLPLSIKGHSYFIYPRSHPFLPIGLFERRHTHSSS
jgi:hypothetical protein